VIFGQNDFKSYFVTADRGVAEAAHSNTTRPRPLAAPLPIVCLHRVEYSTTDYILKCV